MNNQKKEIKFTHCFSPRTIGKPSVPPKQWDEFNDRQKAAIGEHLTAKFLLGCAEMGIKTGYKVVVAKETEVCVEDKRKLAKL